MATQTMGARAEEFILSEANGSRSREDGTVASGRSLTAGTLVQDNGSGKLVASDGNLNTDGTVTTAVKGILLADVDATSADTAGAYLARDAEVKDAFLTYPTESTAGGEKDACQASLADLGIIVR